MIPVSTAWNAGRHAGWAPAVRQLTALGVRRVALDGTALHPDAAEAGRAARAAKGEVVALFAPRAARDAASSAPADPAGLADVRPDFRAAAVAAALAAGRAAAAAGTPVVVLRPGGVPVLDGGREERWDQTLGRDGFTDALRAEVAAARDEMRSARPRFLDALCRSLWELSRALPDAVWCVESPGTLPGLPFPDEAEPLLSELRGRRVGIWLDAAHAARLGALGAADPRAWIDRASGAVRGVTVSDWSPPALGAGGRSPPGTGIVDWAALRGQLSGATLRVLRLPPEVPAEFLADAVRDAARRTA